MSMAESEVAIGDGEEDEEEGTRSQVIEAQGLRRQRDAF